MGITNKPNNTARQQASEWAARQTLPDGAASMEPLPSTGREEPMRPVGREQPSCPVDGEKPTQAVEGARAPRDTAGAEGGTPGQAEDARRLAGRAPAGGSAAIVSAPLPGMEQPTSEADAATWAAVLARLEQQMTAANYQTWLADTRPLGRHGATLVVGAPSGFVRDWLQTRFRALVRRALQEIAPSLTDVTFALPPQDS
jgi:hypothetical protein